MDILYFLGYNLDEFLPWHSTLSRTRQRLPEHVFEKCFEKVLKICIEAGMVEGDVQAIDAAYIGANACLENMQPKDAQLDWQKYVQICNNQAKYTLSVNNSTDTLHALPKEKKRLRSNKTHYSPSDPNARMAKKQGKPCKLYHLASMSVDTFRHVITHINANFADEKDSRHLLDIVKETRSRLQILDTSMHKILADGGFSSGANYAALETINLEGYVSLYGQYSKQREGFTYVAEQDIYLCKQGKVLSNKGIKSDHGYFNFHYRSSATDCKNCLIRQSCCGKSPRKKMTFTAFRNHFNRMERRLNSPMGKRMKKIRMSTVEPVFGSLINYFGLKRINAKGRKAAHKCMVMSAAAYNLKKYLKFSRPRKVEVKQLALRNRSARNSRLLIEEIWNITKMQMQLYWRVTCGIDRNRVVQQPRTFFALPPLPFQTLIFLILFCAKTLCMNQSAIS